MKLGMRYEFNQSRPGFHALSSPSKALTVTQTEQVSRSNGPCGCGARFLLLFESTVTSLRKKVITAKKTRPSNPSFTKRSALVGYARTNQPKGNEHTRKQQCLLHRLLTHGAAANARQDAASFIRLGAPTHPRPRQRRNARRGQAEEEGGGGKGMAATVFWNAGRATMASHQALTWGRAATSPALGVLLR